MRRAVLRARGLALSAGLLASAARADPTLTDAEHPDPGCPAVESAGDRCRRLSRPEPIATHDFRHDGLFGRAGYGVSYFRSAVPKAGDDALGVSAEALIGGTLHPFDRSLVLGGGVIGEGLGSRHPLLAYAAFAQLYPDPRGGFAIQVLAALAILEDAPSVVGPLGALGAGYDLFVGPQLAVGAFARLGYGRGFGDGLRVDAPFASLAAVLTFH